MYYNGKTNAINENSFLLFSELRKVISVIKLMYCVMKIAKQKISLNFVKIRMILSMISIVYFQLIFT